MSFFGGRAHRWKSRRSSCIHFFGGRAHRWRSRHRACSRFFASGARGWRRHCSSCICFFRGRAHRCPPLRTLGTGPSGGCEDTSCRSEASSRRWCFLLVSVISRRPALAAFLLSVASNAPNVADSRDGHSSRRRGAWQRERHGALDHTHACTGARAQLERQGRANAWIFDLPPRRSCSRFSFFTRELMGHSHSTRRVAVVVTTGTRLDLG